ncbi:hypothetical protein OG782_29245 [Streptomyces sp. NBC_00876]|uniref:hypothetical protein n=1 Tax=Streptomyces sp. NBC_00876 TaxID=2975853 RepID=UPI00386EB52B|nr:hypothetical protein OG782_29245 [Streptomyces sp. NBC_00876]
MVTTGTAAGTGSGGAVTAAEAGHTARSRSVHSAPFRPAERSAVAAIDLLRGLAADGGGACRPHPLQEGTIEAILTSGPEAR